MFCEFTSVFFNSRKLNLFNSILILKFVHFRLRLVIIMSVGDIRILSW